MMTVGLLSIAQIILMMMFFAPLFLLGGFGVLLLLVALLAMAYFLFDVVAGGLIQTIIGSLPDGLFDFVSSIPQGLGL